MVNKFFIKNTGLIKASGNDLIDFINRMSTNDFRKLPEGEFRKTVLTTDKGRIIDLINVLNSTNQKYILTSNNFQEKVVTHLNKYIIMDDVTLEKVDEKYFHIVITGKDLTQSGKDLFEKDVALNKIYNLSEDEFLFLDDLKFDSLSVICKEKNLDKYVEILRDLTAQSCEEYELMRIEAGLPEGENEFNDNINPMECGLDKYISFVKGCYIGQEVIARLDSQGKRPKQMVIVTSENALRKDDKIFDEDKEAGFISSSISLSDKTAALGFIRSVNLDYDKEYLVKNTEDKTSKINISKIN